MARKQNPNSLKNLEKGKATRFKSDDKTGKASKSGKKGGVNSGIAKRRKKVMQEAFSMIATLNVSDDNKEVLRNLGIKDENTINAVMLAYKEFSSAFNGNQRAMEFFFEMTGGKPMTELEKERLAIEKEKIQLEKIKAQIELERLELEKKKASASVYDNDDGVEIIV